MSDTAGDRWVVTEDGEVFTIINGVREQVATAGIPGLQEMQPGEYSNEEFWVAFEGRDR